MKDRRKKDRREKDREQKQRIMHCTKRLVRVEGLLKGKLAPKQRNEAIKLFSEEVDELLSALELKREDLM